MHAEPQSSVEGRAFVAGELDTSKLREQVGECRSTICDRERKAESKGLKDSKSKRRPEHDDHEELNDRHERVHEWRHVERRSEGTRAPRDSRETSRRTLYERDDRHRDRRSDDRRRDEPRREGEPRRSYREYDDDHADNRQYARRNQPFDDPRGLVRQTKHSNGRNTESFDPASTYVRPDFRVRVGSRHWRHAPTLSHDDILIVPDFFCSASDLRLYHSLVDEMRWVQRDEPKAEWIPWHEGCHLISKVRAIRSSFAVAC